MLNAIQVNIAVEQFVKELEENADLDVYDYTGDFAEHLECGSGGNKYELSVGTATLADDKFGMEGGGEDIWFVIKIGDQYFRATGYYSSYEGDEWEEGFEEVFPEQKVITVFSTEKKS